MTKVRGPEGFASYIRGQLSIVDGMRIDPHEFIQVGDRIVMPFRLHGRSKHMGLPLDFEYVAGISHRSAGANLAL